MNDILQQFSREIDATAAIFDSMKVSSRACGWYASNCHLACCTAQDGLQGDPPVTRNQPPVAGAIKWERSLFQRVKQTKQKLDTVEKELMADEGGQQVGALQGAQAFAVLGCIASWFLVGHQYFCCSPLLQVHAKYIALARSMQGFEKHWFYQWQEKIDQLAVLHLKQPILKENPETKRSAILQHEVASCSAAQPAWP